MLQYRECVGDKLGFQEMEEVTCGAAVLDLIQTNREELVKNLKMEI